MERVIAVSGGKGGCGKTTLTASLGMELAEKGAKVCLVDACVGMRCLDMLLGVQDRVVYDLNDLANEDCGMDQALISAGQTSVSMIAAPQLDSLCDLDEKKLSRVLERLKKRFDCVLLDTPGVLSPWGLLASALADENLLVSLPGDIPGRNTERACAVLREKNGAPLSLIMNCYDDRAEEALRKLEGTAAYLDLPVIGVIPLCPDVYSAFLSGQALKDYPLAFRTAVSDAARRLRGESVPWKKERSRRFKWHF